MKVHKFGGTSMGNIGLVAEIVREVVARGDHPVVVVSAIGGVTNKLYAALNDRKILQEIQEMHFTAIEGLDLCIEKKLKLAESIANDIAKINSEMEQEKMVTDVLVGFGEIWSSQILASLLSAQFLNARDFLFLLPSEEVRVDWTRSSAALKNVAHAVHVITGFLASDSSGRPTTLKRNGSDHSAAIVANLVGASELTIWTDVDGIFTADPRVVNSAVRIDRMSYKETAELAYFGAKVIHPQTMAPCVTKKIPIVLRNTFNRECAGTLIGVNTMGARAVTCISHVSIINVEGSGLFGFSGIAAKIFGAAAAANINIIMITQASSEYSICFAVPNEDGKNCVEAIRAVFEQEILENSLEVSMQPASIVAAVGEGMHAQKGLLGTLATALGDADVNIVALAQGSSERNITFVVTPEHAIDALRALHRVLIK